MSNGNPGQGGAASNPPLSAGERKQLIARVHEIQDRLREGNLQKPRLPYAAVQQLKNAINELLKTYYNRLPVFVLGRCPYCQKPLQSAFDPWGIDGFWWQQKLTGLRPKPEGCEHFQVLTGALNLNGKPPVGGREDAHVGPAVPYVIPKVLSLPDMTAIVSALPMENGYVAYPIAYFASQPPPLPALANPWTLTSCTFTINGRASFAYMTDPWDFDLLPWVNQGKLRWLEPGDKNHALSRRPPAEFPYATLPGPRLRQTIVKDQVFTAPPPNNEKMNPFTD